MEHSELHTRRNGLHAARNVTSARTLIEAGEHLALASTPEVVAEAALEAGRQLSNSQFGACLYLDLKSEAAAPPLYKHIGFGSSGTRLDPHAPVNFEALHLLDGSVLHRNDLAADAELVRLKPLVDLLAEHGSVRSFLALPIRGQGEATLGALLFGDPAPRAFAEEVAPSVRLLALQAGMAMDRLLVEQRLQEQTAEAERARDEQRAIGRRLEQVLEAAQLGTWSWDAGTGLITFDDRGAELIGVPPGVPVPRNRLRERIVHPEDLHRSPTDLRTVLAAGGQYAAEYRVNNAAGEVRWISANGRASMEPGQGRFTGMIGTVQDITARKHQEDTLRTSEKLAATGRLAATIAHEINNPLEAVTNLIYLAKTDPLTPPAVSRMLETADTELARVSQIAQQTLGFYRDTSRPVSVNLNELLQAVVDLFDRKLTGKRLRCTLDLEPGLYIVGLQGEIRQVVSNLLVNAIDASESAGGKIHIRTRRRRRNGNRGVSVIISDQGSGIPHHVRHRLFTPFTTTKQSLGTGLGLWVTQGMVEKHGGSVRFRSRTEYPSGTVFRVYLPESGSPQLFAHQSTSTLQ